mmetsp:Transcript_19842/g.31099  ORF Transcript_19842/g.31099 Transcript_19842/m.31099 type:complete len:115 (+) Transcript_19842:728-1072(+)
MAVFSHASFTLEHLDVHTWLIVTVGREGLTLLGRNSSVSLDQCGHDSTCCFDTKSERCNVKEEKSFCLLALSASQNVCLHSCSVCDGFVWVDALVQLLATEELTDKGLHFGNAG